MQCPVQPMQCPVQHIQRPVQPTQCPVQRMQCPMQPMQCPVEHMKCPIQPMQCPNLRQNPRKNVLTSLVFGREYSCYVLEVFETDFNLHLCLNKKLQELTPFLTAIFLIWLFSCLLTFLGPAFGHSSLFCVWSHFFVLHLVTFFIYSEFGHISFFVLSLVTFCLFVCFCFRSLLLLLALCSVSVDKLSTYIPSVIRPSRNT